MFFSKHSLPYSCPHRIHSSIICFLVYFQGFCICFLFCSESHVAMRFWVRQILNGSTQPTGGRSLPGLEAPQAHPWHVLIQATPTRQQVSPPSALRVLGRLTSSRVIRFAGGNRTTGSQAALQCLVSDGNAWRSLVQPEQRPAIHNMSARLRGCPEYVSHVIE